MVRCEELRSFPADGTRDDPCSDGAAQTSAPFVALRELASVSFSCVGPPLLVFVFVASRLVSLSSGKVALIFRSVFHSIRALPLALFLHVSKKSARDRSRTHASDPWQSPLLRMRQQFALMTFHAGAPSSQQSSGQPNRQRHTQQEKSRTDDEQEPRSWRRCRA